MRVSFLHVPRPIACLGTHVCRQSKEVHAHNTRLQLGVVCATYHSTTSCIYKGAAFWATLECSIYTYVYLWTLCIPSASVSHMQVTDVYTEGADPFPPIAKPAFMEVSVCQEVRCSNQVNVMGAAGGDGVSSRKCFDLVKIGRIWHTNRVGTVTLCPYTRLYRFTLCGLGWYRHS